MDEKWGKIRTKNNDRNVGESNSENHLFVCYPNNCKNKISNWEETYQLINIKKLQKMFFCISWYEIVIHEKITKMYDIL